MPAEERWRGFKPLPLSNELVPGNKILTRPGWRLLRRMVKTGESLRRIGPKTYEMTTRTYEEGHHFYRRIRVNARIVLRLLELGFAVSVTEPELTPRGREAFLYLDPEGVWREEERPGHFIPRGKTRKGKV